MSPVSATAKSQKCFIYVQFSFRCISCDPLSVSIKSSSNADLVGSITLVLASLDGIRINFYLLITTMDNNIRKKLVKFNTTMSYISFC